MEWFERFELVMEKSSFFFCSLVVFRIAFVRVRIFVSMWKLRFVYMCSVQFVAKFGPIDVLLFCVRIHVCFCVFFYLFYFFLFVRRNRKSDKCECTHRLQQRPMLDCSSQHILAISLSFSFFVLFLLSCCCCYIYLLYPPLYIYFCSFSFVGLFFFFSWVENRYGT